MMLALVLLLSSVVAFYFVEYRRKRKPFVDRVNKFGGPPTLPIIGNLHHLMGSTSVESASFPPPIIMAPSYLIENHVLYLFEDMINRLTKWKYESPYRFWIVNEAFIVIAKPEDIQILATKNLEKDEYYKYLRDLMGDGLITCSVAKWKRRRRIVDRAFNTTIWANYFLEVFNQRNWSLVQILSKEAGNGKHFDLWPYIISASFSTICDTAMGYKEEEEHNGQTQIKESKDIYLKASQLAFARCIKPWLQSKLIFSIYSYIIGCPNIFEKCQELPRKLVKKKRQSFRNEKGLNNNEVLINGKQMKNILEILLEKQDGDNNYTDEELSDEMLTIIVAGTETNALVDSFTLLMLAMRPDIQEKVYQEQVEIFSNSNRLPTAEDLHAMELLEKCIKESLRLFSTVPLIHRQADTDIPITNGQVIPAGCRIIIAPYIVHHCEKYYSNPDEWNPYNFDADRIAERHAYSFLPFGTGPRTCLGNKYAMLSMKHLLSSIIRNFELSTDVKMEDLKYTYDFVFRSDCGYRVKLYRRKESSFFLKIAMQRPPSNKALAI